MTKDYVASHLPGKTDFILVNVKGNGNCLFNALSMAIQGNESLSTEIRVRTCLELYQYKGYYINFHKEDQLFLLCPPYDDAIRTTDNIH